MRDWLSSLFRKRPAAIAASSPTRARANRNTNVYRTNTSSPARANRANRANTTSPARARANRTNMYRAPNNAGRNVVMVVPASVAGLKRARSLNRNYLSLMAAPHSSPNRTKRVRTNVVVQQRQSPPRPQRWWAISVAATTGAKRRRNNTHTSVNNAARVARQFAHSRRLNN